MNGAVQRYIVGYEIGTDLDETPVHLLKREVPELLIVSRSKNVVEIESAVNPPKKSALSVTTTPAL